MDQKENLVRLHDCGHPLTAHTGTEATWPWKVCARPECGCLVLSGAA